jgi:hypothetical protein
MFNFDPSRFTRLQEGGTGNMGTLLTNLPPGRFNLKGRAFYLSCVRVHFEAGSGSASMTIYRQREGGFSAATNQQLAVCPAVGTGTEDAYFSVDDNHAKDFYFAPDETLVLTWTNPGGGMTWAATVEVQPA